MLLLRTALQASALVSVRAVAETSGCVPIIPSKCMMPSRVCGVSQVWYFGGLDLYERSVVLCRKPSENSHSISMYRLNIPGACQGGQRPPPEPRTHTYTESPYLQYLPDHYLCTCPVATPSGRKLSAAARLGYRPVKTESNSRYVLHPPCSGKRSLPTGKVQSIRFDCLH